MELTLKQEQKQLNQLKVPQYIELKVPEQIELEAPQELNKQAKETDRQAQEELNRKTEKKFSRARATKVASGTPSQQQLPAEKTYKARRAEKRRERAARKKCPVRDIAAADEIQRQLEDYYTQHANSQNSYFESHPDSNLSGVDTRAVYAFSHGFRKNWLGKPATEDDEKYRQEDEKLYETFCSTDYELRRPYLERMVDEVLSFDLKKEMFSERNMQNHAADIKTMAERLVCMDNIIKDEHNKFFFKELSPVKWIALGQALEIGALMGTAFGARCAMQGIKEAGAQYISAQEEIDAYSPQAEMYVPLYKSELRVYKSMKDILESAVSIEQRASQIDKVDTEKLPAPEFYKKIRGLLEPNVQKLLSCNVEELCKLSDEDLKKKSAELNELYTVSLDLDNCLQFKHPVRQTITLRDEMIGQRRLEYDYKLSVLRGLVDRAAGHNERGEKAIADATQRYQNQMTPGTPEFQEFFLELGGQNLANLVAIDPKFDAVMKEYYNNIEFPQKYRTEVVKRLHDHHYFSLDEEKRKSLNKPSDIGESLFRSLDSFLCSEAAETLLTSEKLRQMLNDLGAGGDLISDLSEYEKKLEQAIEQENVEEQQKLAIKKKDIEEQRKLAIERNNAGLDTLREVMDAQYEMLERKYGNSIEQMTIEDIREHYLEIAKDFANIQIDFHMAAHFPGFVRKNPDDGKDNPDDVRLYNRIQYYNVCSITIAGLIPFIGMGAIPDLTTVDGQEMNMLDVSDENIQKYISFSLKDEDGAKARKELMGDKECHFQHPFDWSQKVKKPADEN